MRALELVLSRLAGVAAFIGGLAILTMMFQVAFDVMLKHFFNTPIPGTLEMVSAYYMAAMVFLPLGMVTRDHEHLEVELFTQNLSPRRLAGVKAFGCFVGSLYVGIMLWEGYGEAVYMTSVGEIWETATWDMPVWPARWFFPVGCALMLAYFVLLGIDHVAFASAGVQLIPHRGAHQDGDDPSAGDDGAIGVGLDGRHGGGSAD